MADEARLCLIVHLIKQWTSPSLLITAAEVKQTSILPSACRVVFVLQFSTTAQRPGWHFHRWNPQLVLSGCIAPLPTLCSSQEWQECRWTTTTPCNATVKGKNRTEEHLNPYVPLVTFQMVWTLWHGKISALSKLFHNFKPPRQFVHSLRFNFLLQCRYLIIDEAQNEETACVFFAANDCIDGLRML